MPCPSLPRWRDRAIILGAEGAEEEAAEVEAGSFGRTNRE